MGLLFATSPVVAVLSGHLAGRLDDPHGVDVAVDVEVGRVQSKGGYFAVGVRLEATVASLPAGQIERRLEAKVWVQKVASPRASVFVAGLGGSISVA